MTNFTIRAPLATEASQLAELGRACFIETFAHLYKPEDLQTFLNETYGTDIQAAQIADSATAIQIAEADGARIGFIRIAPMSMPFATEGRKAGELKQLYVRKAWHGKGVAEALMDWAMVEFKQQHYADVFLSVFSENPRAQKFYKRHGFEKVADYFFMVGKQRDVEFVFKAELA